MIPRLNNKCYSMDAKKVMIIDDDQRNVFALTAVLRARGYECYKALSMEEAFPVLTTHPGIDVILLDMMMPDIDGYRAIPMLRAREDTKHTPVIAVTAQAMKGDRERCLEAGADGYISKPVNIDELVKVMDELKK